MSKDEKPREVSFELTRAEFLGSEQQKEISNKTEGLVAIEKTAHSLPTIKLHYIGKEGIVNFIKKIEDGKI